jgi:replicative DNA helicase
MAQKSTEQVIVGTLIKNPKLLLQTDKYQLTPDDFDTPLYRYVFWAIENMAPGATGELRIFEIENWLDQNANAKAVFENKGGRQVLQDCSNTDVSSFETQYTLLKKENLIRDLQRFGYDRERICPINPISESERELSTKFANSSTEDILEQIQSDFVKLQSKYVLKDTSEVQTLFAGMEEMLEDLKETPEIGLPLQGKLFNHIVSGAIFGRFYLRSGASGLGKTRNLMGDACHFAYPIRYDWNVRKWVARRLH